MRLRMSAKGTAWFSTATADRHSPTSAVGKHSAGRGWPDRTGHREVCAFSGKYVMHCHNLAYEDHSMMAHFEVV